jgi:hypothetical protein
MHTHRFKSPLLASLAALAAKLGARMAYVDAQQLFSDAQALSATAASTNSIDLSQDRNIGVGVPLAVVITFDVALAGTTPTFVATIQADDNSGFSSAATVAAGPSLSAAAAGAQQVIPLPPDVTTERFIRLNYTLGGTTPTCTVTAYLTPMNQVPVPLQFAAGTTVNN